VAWVEEAFERAASGASGAVAAWAAWEPGDYPAGAAPAQMTGLSALCQKK